MSLSGQLDIQVLLSSVSNKYTIKDVSINLSRPDLANKFLVGQTPVLAIERISQMMTVCQHAQVLAAKLALDEPYSDDDLQALQYENIEQLLWRLLLDLPKVCNVTVPLDDFIALRQAIKKQTDIKSIEKLSENTFLQLCHITSQEFLALTTKRFYHWLTKSVSPMAQCLRELAKQHQCNNQTEYDMEILKPTEQQLTDIITMWQTDGTYCQYPHINHHSLETGSFGQHQHLAIFDTFKHFGLLGRFCCRLLDIATHIQALTSKTNRSNLCGSITIFEQQLAWVQTARGLLLHITKINQERISQYAILAPTEWNFHPKGSLTIALQGSSYATVEQAKKTTQGWVLALDPCIEFTIGVSHA